MPDPKHANPSGRERLTRFVYLFLAFFLGRGLSPIPKQQLNMSGITTFAADGRRLRDHSFESIARLEQLKLIIVQRNRKGDILCAHFYGQTRTPVKTRLKPGTRYSYRELVSDGRRRWTHSQLPRIPVSPALSCSQAAAELHRLRVEAFAAVSLSVMRTPESVVSIEHFRPRELPISTSQLTDKLAA